MDAGKGDVLTDDGLIKSISESDETVLHVQKIIERNPNGTDVFLRRIKASVHEKEAEIASLCDTHYQDFIRSVDEMLGVRADATDLRELAISLNMEVQEAGRELQIKTSSLNNNHAALSHTRQVKSLLSGLQEILTEFLVAQTQCKRKRFIPALKCVLHVKQVMLPRLGLPSLLPHLETRADDLCNEIRNSSISAFNTWLLIARKQAFSVGEGVLKAHNAKQQTLRSATGRVVSWTKDGALALSKLSSAVPDISDVGDVLGDVRIDNAAVHQCVHVHHHLSVLPVFQQYYIENRKKQICLDFEVLEVDSNDTLEHAVYVFLARALGYFVIETSLFKSAPTLLTHAQLEDLWEMAAVRMKAAILEHTIYISDDSVALTLTQHITLVSNVLQMLELNTTILMKIHATLREQWDAAARQKIVRSIESIYVHGTYQPLTVTNKKEYNSLVAPLNLPDSKPVKFPYTYSFSQMFVDVCGVVLRAVDEAFEFVEENSAPTSVTRTVEQLLEQGVVRTVNRVMDKGSSLTLSQAALLSSDCSAFISFCATLESHIASHSHQWSQASRLNSRAQLHNARERALRLIPELMEQKIRHFLSDIDESWSLNTPPQGPTDGISDLLLFAISGFICLESLGDRTRISDLFSFFVESVAQTLKQSLLSTKKITAHGLEQMGADIQTLEQYAQDHNINPTPALLGMRQLLDLLLGGNAEGILDDGIRTTLYTNIDTKDLRVVLEKFKDSSSGSSVVSKFPGFGGHTPRGHTEGVLTKKQAESILKRLK